MRFKNDFILLTLALLSAGTSAHSNTVQAVTVGLADSGQPVSSLKASDDLRYLSFVGDPRRFGLVNAPVTGLLHVDTTTGSARLLDRAGTYSTSRYQHDMSGDGRFVVYTAAPDSGSFRQIRLFDNTTGTSVQITTSPTGASGNGPSEYPSISGDGRFIVFESAATNLHPSDTDDRRDVLLYDRTTGQFQVISNGNPALGSKVGSFFGSISRDGSRVVFTSNSPNLVSNDTSGQDVFLFYRPVGTLSKVSVNVQGGNSQGNAFRGWIDPTGQFVLFHGSGADLAPGTTPTTAGMFLRDLAAGTTTWTGIPPTVDLVFTPDGSHALLSPSSGSTSALNLATRTIQPLSDNPAPRTLAGSASLGSIVFSSLSRLTTDDRNQGPDLFRRSLSSGAITRLVPSSAQEMMNVATEHLVVSADGSKVAWSNRASNIQTWPSPAGTALTGFRDMASGASVPLDLSLGGLPIGATEPASQRISADGRFITSSGPSGLRLIDTVTADVRLIARDFETGAAIPVASRVQMSADSRYIAFASNSNRVVPGLVPVAGNPDRVYLYDRTTDSVRLISPANQFLFSFIPVLLLEMDIDGRVVEFTSGQSNAVSYRYDISTGTTTLAPSQAVDRTNASGIVAPFPLDRFGSEQQYELDSPYRQVNPRLYLSNGGTISASPNLRLIAGYLPGGPQGFQIAVRDLESGRLQVLPFFGTDNQSPFVISRDHRHLFFQSRAQLTERLNSTRNFYRTSLEPTVDSAPRIVLSLNGFDGNWSFFPVIIEVIQGGNVVEELRPAISQGQSFMVAPVTTGPATLRIRHRSGLAKRVNVTLGSGLQPMRVNLITGDINQDNEIGPADFSLLAARYNETLATENLVDLNGDLEVGAADFSILAANYGAVGE